MGVHQHEESPEDERAGRVGDGHVALDAVEDARRDARGAGCAQRRGRRERARGVEQLEDVSCVGTVTRN